MCFLIIQLGAAAPDCEEETGGAWHGVVPESVKFAPATGMNCQSYASGCRVTLSTPKVLSFRTWLVAKIDLPNW